MKTNQKCVPSRRKLLLLSSCILLIIVSSLIPMDHRIEGLNFIISMNPRLQNFLHIPMYTLLTILWLQFIQGYNIPTWKIILLTLLFTSAFGIMNECVQMLIPGRYASFGDVLRDLIGAAIGLTIFYILQHSKPSLLRKLVCE